MNKSEITCKPQDCKLYEAGMYGMHLIPTLNDMEEEIKLGDLVQTTDGEIKGYVSGIKDYGTHVCYFIDCGALIKFPAKREWIEKVK